MGSAAMPILAASSTTLLLSIALLSHHSIHPFAPVRAADDNSNVVTSFAQFPHDENNHLASHILAYPAAEPCKSLIEAQLATQSELYMHHPFAVDGDVASALFPDYKPSSPASTLTDCPLVCLDRGIDAHLVPHPMPQKYFNPNSNEESHHSLHDFISSNSCGKVEIAVINYTPHLLDFYWVDTNNNKEVYLYQLERKEANTRFIHTFLSHRFIAKHPDTAEILMDITVEFAGTFGIGNHENPKRQRDVREQVRSTMDGEWTKKQMVKRTFSKLGFDKGRLPNDLYGSMRSFYYNNR
jgi:hypothetical protein